MQALVQISLFGSLLFRLTQGFATSYQYRLQSSSRVLLAENDSNEKKENADNDSLSVTEPMERWNEFLDTPFFDPDDDENNPAWLQSLAEFVKNDYEPAEVVLAGSFITVMILVSQELVRIQLYGDRYVPFSSGSNGLF